MPPTATYISKHTGGQSDCDTPVTSLQRATALLQPASQPADIGLLPPVAPTDLRSRQQKSVPICTHFSCSYFVTTTAIDIKPSACPVHGRYASACHISPSYDAAFRSREATDKVNKLSNI